MTLRLAARSLTCFLAVLVAAPLFAANPPGKLTIKVDQPAHKIPATLYGLMTEEINHCYDGGLYAELISNRVFKDDPKNPVHWSFVKADGFGQISLDNANPITNTSLTTCLRLDVANGQVGVSNDGFWGIPVLPGKTYTVSFYAKASADFTEPLAITLQPKAIGAISGIIPGGAAAGPKLTTEWKKYTVQMTPMSGTPAYANGVFSIFAKSKGTVWLNQVSLMPPTYKNTPNGNRIDLMEKLADLQPAFLRFPGGNYLEGNTIAERFNWKETIGPLENRPGHMCPWGYRSSDGMGLMEFLRWCEDLKMEPILGVFAGYALQGEHVTGEALKPHIQDALDEIEYITGDVDTKWGAQRAKDGHPEPFKLTYVEVGNEDQFDRSGSYDSRFTDFYDAIKAKYPNLQLIATTPVKTRKPDLVDDHYYRSARDMQNDVHHYDKLDRNGPKIFVGEWATTEGSPTPTMNAALGDAAWLTGMERNSDLIVISAYAPLLVNVNPGASQWGTNLIGYDALKSFGSPSYYVQRMFNQNRGDVVLPVAIVPQISKPVVAPPPPHGGIGVASWSTNVQYKDLKVTKSDGTVLFTSDFSKGTAPFKFFKGDWKADEGTLHQSGNDTECRAIAGDPAWGDVDYTVKARKLGGAEGFIVMFDVKDDNNYLWFNAGGWNNTRTALEVGENGARRVIGNDSNFAVETNRWYDVKIEARGNKSTCYVDGKQILAATYEPPPVPDPLYATASRDDATGDVIVKVVNIADTVQQMDLEFQGLTARPDGRYFTGGTVEILQGEPGWVNTIDQPEKVAPKKSDLRATGASFTNGWEFPAHSVSILRFKTK
jgi:alpha-L-arabinofuranosidase